MLSAGVFVPILVWVTVLDRTEWQFSIGIYHWPQYVRKRLWQDKVGITRPHWTMIAWPVWIHLQAYRVPLSDWRTFWQGFSFDSTQLYTTVPILPLKGAICLCNSSVALHIHMAARTNTHSLGALMDWTVLQLLATHRVITAAIFINFLSVSCY